MSEVPPEVALVFESANKGKALCAAAYHCLYVQGRGVDVLCSVFTEACSLRLTVPVPRSCLPPTQAYSSSGALCVSCSSIDGQVCVLTDYSCTTV